MVAAATNNLCEAANSAVQGHASEEKLISSAKQVAASTAQLLVACKVKADQDSQTMKRLQVSRIKRRAVSSLCLKDLNGGGIMEMLLESWFPSSTADLLGSNSELAHYSEILDFLLRVSPIEGRSHRRWLCNHG